MSRFAVVYEDPDYEDWADSLESDEGDWIDDASQKQEKPADIIDWLNQKLVDF
jgi:hypothetical protein